ncbi:TPA: hypothetical protein MI403_01680 [Klebsiella pneumoniae]|nr:hypothetical protein D0896_08515 [Klebsiella pneumoniae]HBX3907982.1 hypothetical protein [Klebsiella pneumoniae subsp. pneumoniae]RGA09831.1 hypothetical protein COO49_12275 [Klebsiella pneumoniae]RMA18684.1 hypothetical protein EA161_06470 [Klebsiella pneumoniae]RRY58347.1 hypothetical protein EGJ93_05170 [Klebsiella pneumoniae]
MFRRPGKAEAATRQTCEHNNEDRFVITRKPSEQRAFLCLCGYSLSQFFIIILIIVIIIFIIFAHYG